MSVPDTVALVSLEDYLSTAYEPDRDFVDGVPLERHSGTQRHGLLQTFLILFFGQFIKSHRIAVFTETRLRVDADTGRHRVPDVMIVEAPYTRGKIVTDVPAIVLEIKSPDDTFDDILDRCFDYEKLTVANIIVMDPDNKRAWTFKNGALHLASGVVQLPLADSLVAFSLPELFAELDEANQ
jgi:Uma2 family endonuclease